MHPAGVSHLKWDTLSLGGFPLLEHPEQLRHRIKELVNHTLLQRDDGVVGDGDVLGAHLCAALGDVAVADAVFVFEVGDPVFGVEGVHFEGRGVDEEAGADELIVFVVVAEDVADILAEEALDALAELLDAVHVGLVHAPGAVGGVGLAGLEGLNAFLDVVVPGDVGDEVLDEGEGLHGLDNDGHVGGELIHPRHAHEAGLAVDFGGAGAALAGLAVPAAGEVLGLLGLDLVDDVEDDHAGGDGGGVVLEPARVAGFCAAPDAEELAAGAGFGGLGCGEGLVWEPFGGVWDGEGFVGGFGGHGEGS
jgi:hypothetical protein